MTRATVAGRRGIASLEFVLVLPFLLALTAGLFILGMGAEHKGHSIVAARHDAWRNRAQAPPGRVLQLGADPLASKVQVVHQENYTPAFVIRTNFTAESRNGVVGNPWDSHAIPFAPAQGNFTPHLDPLSKIVANIPVPNPVILVVQTFAKLMNLPDSQLIRALAPLNRIAKVGLVLAAAFLQTLIPVIEGAKLAAEIALDSIGLFAWGLRSKLHRAIDLFNQALDAVHNLWEAAHGRPGHWSDSLSHHLEES
jgi:hypothetical protein